MFTHPPAACAEFVRCYQHRMEAKMEFSHHPEACESRCAEHSIKALAIHLNGIAAELGQFRSQFGPVLPDVDIAILARTQDDLRHLSGWLERKASL